MKVNIILIITLIILMISLTGCINDDEITYENAFAKTPYYYEYNICTDVCDFMAKNRTEQWDCKIEYCESVYLTDEKWNAPFGRISSEIMVNCPEGYITWKGNCLSENAIIYDNKQRDLINPIDQLIPSAHCDVVCEPMLFLEQRTCVGLEICMCDYIDLNSPSTYKNCSWAELIPQ